MTALGQQIKQIRLEHGLTQAEFGERANGIAAPHLSDIENGKVSPSGQTLERIAQAFGLSLVFVDRTKGLVTEIPSVLEEFAQEVGLSRAEVLMLAAQRYRGKPIRTKEGYRFLWDAIQLVCGAQNQ